MPSVKDDLEQADQLQKQTGRINKSQLSALKPTDTANATQKRYGRINVAQYKDVTTAKPQRRKATQRKRVAGK